MLYSMYSHSHSHADVSSFYCSHTDGSQAAKHRRHQLLLPPLAGKANDTINEMDRVGVWTSNHRGAAKKNWATIVTRYIFLMIFLFVCFKTFILANNYFEFMISLWMVDHRSLNSATSASLLLAASLFYWFCCHSHHSEFVYMKSYLLDFFPPN